MADVARPIPVLLLGETGLYSHTFPSIVAALRERGVAPTLATVRPRVAFHADAERAGCEAVSLGATRALGYPRAAATLVRIIRDRGIALVHAHEAIPAAIASVAAARARRPSIFHRHSLHALRGQRLLTRIASALSTRMIVVSDASARVAHDADGVPMPRIRVCHNGTDVSRPVSAEETSALRARLGIGASDAVIAMVARLRPDKGHRTLLAASAAIQASVAKKVVIVFVGAGPEDAALRLDAERLRAEVRFVGHQDDVALWHAMADVIAIPSEYEAFGMTAIESMASSRPIVASATGGLLEVLEHERTALLVPAGDPGALARALARLLSDTPLAERLARAGRATYDARFTTSRMVDRWVEVYRELARAT